MTCGENHGGVDGNTDASGSDRTKILFDGIIAELRGVSGEELSFPREIMWLGGPPGAGKGTNTPLIQSLSGITSEPIIMSDLFRTPEMRARIDQGFFIDDRAAIFLLLSTLLAPQYHGGVIVDGFPRTVPQADVVRRLHAYCTAHAAAPPVFRVVVIGVDGAVSIARQTARGAEAQATNDRIERGEEPGEPMEVRPTDLDPAACRLRYDTYVRETGPALARLEGLDGIEHMVIDGMPTLPAVEAELTAAFTK